STQDILVPFGAVASRPNPTSHSYRNSNNLQKTLGKSTLSQPIAYCAPVLRRRYGFVPMSTGSPKKGSKKHTSAGTASSSGAGCAYHSAFRLRSEISHLFHLRR